MNIFYKYISLNDINIDNIKNQAKQYSLKKNEYLMDYIQRELEYVLSNILIVYKNNKYDFLNYDCCSIGDNIDNDIDLIMNYLFNSNKPISYIIITNFVNNEYYCTNKEITDKINSNLNNIKDVSYSNISEVIDNILFNTVYKQ